MGVMIVVSGLPASGKSTVGRSLGERLALPFIDKDDILEALFDSLGSPDPEARSRLSRASDEVLFSLAATTPSGVLVNWWDHDTAPARLHALATSLVDVAVRRFRRPLSLGGPLLTVDTERPVDVADLTERIRSLLP